MTAVAGTRTHDASGSSSALTFPRTVGYILRSFPEPSETFIAEEAASLLPLGVRPLMLYLYDGDRSVLQEDARALIAQGLSRKISSPARVAMLASLCWLLVTRSLHTLRTLLAAIANGNWKIALKALAAARHCVRERVDVLHAHFADENLSWAAVISGYTGIPYGVTTHRYDILDDPIAPAKAKQLYREAGTLVTISRFNRDLMVSKFGLAPERIDIVHCGIDLSRFCYLDRKPRSGDAPLKLLNVGRLVTIKAQDVLLKAAAILKDRGIPFHLDIIGSGRLHEDLSQLAARLQLQSWVTFHGAQPAAFVRARLAQADVFVLSSRSEGLPVSCIEALAVGTPVIATAIFGIPELIEDRVTGSLVPAEDPEALATAIQQAWHNPEAFERMRSQGRLVVEREFDRRICSRQLLSTWSRSLVRDRA